MRTKWGSEYKLYTLINEYCGDALYQYRPIWLGQQSFDIFIPSQNVAVEYQGLQHYEAVDIFGGQESLISNKERDARKRKLSVAHGVRVLDWKYDREISPESVRSFLAEHGVTYTTSQPRFATKEPISLGALEMAPVLPDRKKTGERNGSKKERKIDFSSVIRQYSSDGRFLQEYPSVADATMQSGVSAKTINNAIYNVRPLGGGYIWKRCKRDSAIEEVAAVQRRENTGVAKRVFQYSTDGSFIAEYKSMGEAARQVGVSSRSISDALSGVQKTAGGYIWKYAER